MFALEVRTFTSILYATTMKTPIDLNTWNRKEHFLLFSKYDNPFWSVSAHVDATQVYQKSKERHLSFAAAYHWAATKAANEVDALRMRIENDLPVLYDRIHVSTTIARPDGTFGFSFTKYESDFEKFHKDFIIETKRVQSETGLKSPYTDVDVIYCTVLKNIRFTSMEHAQWVLALNAVRISRGKIQTGRSCSKNCSNARLLFVTT